MSGEVNPYQVAAEQAASAAADSLQRHTSFREGRFRKYVNRIAERKRLELARIDNGERTSDEDGSRSDDDAGRSSDAGRQPPSEPGA